MFFQHPTAASYEWNQGFWVVWFMLESDIEVRLKEN